MTSRAVILILGVVSSLHGANCGNFLCAQESQESGFYAVHVRRSSLRQNPYFVASAPRVVSGELVLLQPSILAPMPHLAYAMPTLLALSCMLLI
jgi:hypothetical protein